jgi:hypothetical protein
LPENHYDDLGALDQEGQREQGETGEMDGFGKRVI